jgi:hypothetical protein
MSNWTSEGVTAGNQVTASPVIVNPVPPETRKKKRSSLAVLVVLFLFAWGLMASLIVEQGRTIESQRWLIQSLFQDSSKLTQMEGRDFQKRRAEAQAQAAAKAHSQVQTPSTQEKTQNQAKDQSKQSQASNSHNPSKLRRPVPQPPTDADTITDERRTVLTI